MTQKDKWQKMKDLGESRFILIYGVCGWGLLTAILFIGLEIVVDKRYSLEAILSPVFLWQVGTAIIIFPGIGYFWGRYMWKNLEKRIRK